MPRQLWPMERRGSGGQLQAGGSGEGEEEARDGGVHDPAGEEAVLRARGEALARAREPVLGLFRVPGVMSGR